jgi:short-subunit dehydrogenase
MLDEVGRDLAREHRIQYRTVRVDLAEPDFLSTLIDAINDLDVGLIVSNAGDMNMGEFLATPHDALLAELRVNTEAHLSLTHHFGLSLARRGAGGILLCPPSPGSKACRTSRTTPPASPTCSASAKPYTGSWPRAAST